ncbi:MAG: hypothetical protein V8T10_10680 [Merdibacter sp.]
MAHPLSRSADGYQLGRHARFCTEWLKAEGGQIVDSSFGTLAWLIGGIFNSSSPLSFSVYVLFGKEKLTRQASRLIRV